MSHDHVKALAAGAVLLILIARLYLKLRSLDGDSRDRAMKKALSSEVLAIAAVAGLFLYLLFKR
jgi:hypothetical protein